ncbi:hypothetical protein [Funiculus sociatus]
MELEFLGVITYLTTDVILSYLNSAIAWFGALMGSRKDIPLYGTY